ncbi:hypothetical protein VTH82DRAFT_8453 [Thermothelomyces myriococcoides]
MVIPRAALASIGMNTITPYEPKISAEAGTNQLYEAIFPATLLEMMVEAMGGDDLVTHDTVQGERGLGHVDEETMSPKENKTTIL